MAFEILGGAALSLGNTILNRVESSDQRQFLRSMWDANNRYNSPAAQRKRLEQAGINPAFAMQNGMMDSGAASQPSAPSLPSYDFSPASSALNTAAQLDLQERQVESDARLKDENTIAQQQRNKFGLYDAYFDVLNKIADLRQKGADTSFLVSQKDYLEKQIGAFDRRNNAEVNKIDKEATVAEKQAALIDLQSSYQKIVNQYLPKEKQKSFAVQDATISELYSAAARHDAEAAYAAANKAVSEATKEGLDIDNSTKSRIADALVDEAFSKADESYWNSQRAKKDYTGGHLGRTFGSNSWDTPASDRKHRGSVPIPRNKQKGGVR